MQIKVKQKAIYLSLAAVIGSPFFPCTDALAADSKSTEPNKSAPGKLVSALPAPKTAAQEGPEIEHLAAYCGKLWRQKKRRSALQIVNDGLAKYPKSVRLLSLRSVYYCDIYEDELAIEGAQKVLALKPDSEQASVVEATVFNRTGRPAEALAKLDSAMKYHPNSHEIGYMRAISLLSLKRNQEALRDLDRICAIDPGNPQYHRSRGRCLMDLKMYKRAITDYQWLTTADAENAAASFSTLGDCYFFIKDLPNARKAYEAAIKIDRDELNGHRGLENVYRAMGDDTMAEAEKRTVKRIESDLSP